MGSEGDGCGGGGDRGGDGHAFVITNGARAKSSASGDALNRSTVNNVIRVHLGRVLSFVS